jgi:D-alanine-D-alanine ligase-like ATP-grasp enzyme
MKICALLSNTNGMIQPLIKAELDMPNGADYSKTHTSVLENLGYEVIDYYLTDELETDKQNILLLNSEVYMFIILCEHDKNCKDIIEFMNSYKIFNTSSFVPKEYIFKRLGISKLAMQDLCIQNNIATPKYIFITTETISSLNNVISTLQYPLFLKPVNGHDSIGIDSENYCNNFDEVYNKCIKLLKISQSGVIIQEYVDGDEYTTFTLGDENYGITVLKPTKVYFDQIKFKTMNDKFKDCTYRHDIFYDESIGNLIQNTCQRAHKMLNIHGYTRMDIRYANGKVFVLDINVYPDLFDSEETEYSEINAILRCSNMTYEELTIFILDYFAYKNAMSIPYYDYTIIRQSINYNNVIKRLHYIPDQETFYFCGAYIIASVLNYLNIPAPDNIELYPFTTWTYKLICNKVYSYVKMQSVGININDFTELLKSHLTKDYDCKRYLQHELTMDVFRNYLNYIAAENNVIIVNYHRQTINSKWSNCGHYAVIMSYIPSRDIVLVSEMSKYNGYQPFWIPIKHLLRSILQDDHGDYRGIVVIKKIT